MGSTPVASGSRVPACPTFRATVRVRSARTISNDVSPAGLSRLRTPGFTATRRARERRMRGGDDQLDRPLHRLGDLRAGGSEVATAAELGGQGGRVHRAPAPDADLRHLVADLLEKDRQVEAGDGVEVVDDALRLGHDRVRLL